jgi:hypothetical protein
MDNTTSQCPNCHQWFTNKRSLRLHISSCWPKHSNEKQGHAPFQHHPLKSSSYHGGKNDKMIFSHNHTDYDVDAVNSGGTDQMVILLNHDCWIMIIAMAMIMIPKDNKALQCQRYKSS